MTCQVRFHLPFRFHHKPEAAGVAQACCDSTHCIGAGIPERIEHTGMGIQFFKSLRSPGQVIFLFTRGIAELLSGLRIA